MGDGAKSVIEKGQTSSSSRNRFQASSRAIDDQVEDHGVA